VTPARRREGGMAKGTDGIARDALQRADAIVVGGGHAGIEATWALARLGHTVALVTLDPAGVGRMSCNPSVGGLAKGQLVREIDALGGLMGRLADATGIHFRMLNRRKGPAVHAPRAQVDKRAYAREARLRLSAQERVTLVPAEAIDLLSERASGAHPRVCGVRLRGPGAGEILARAVVLAPGTFLEGTLFTGMSPRPGGRRDEPAAQALSRSLRALGLRLGRLKTGTPPRLRRDSIDFAALATQPGDEPPPRFSFFERTPVRNRVLCHLTRTTAATHRAIAAGLDRSPLYGGLIRGVGPRYCPSIEDKVVRFPERTSHPIFLEPEGIDSDRVYPNGITTSLPRDVQEEFVRTIPGLERAEIVHPGYAVEYSFLPTSQIDAALRVRGVDGLFAAGQINGTSGYEEAAAQGLIAGLSAAAWLAGRPPVILQRSEAYIGVLIDDLVTKVPTEPYRMFTSQSEYRLLLRQDNADRRLSARGRRLGLLSEDDWRVAEERRARVDGAMDRLTTTRFDRQAMEDCGRGAALGENDIGRSLADLLRRPEVGIADIRQIGLLGDCAEADLTTIEADVKYEGYINRLYKEIEDMQSIERLVIPEVLLEDLPASLSREAREILRERRPRTIGQATRLPGITPCDVSILAVRIRCVEATEEKTSLAGTPSSLGSAEE
jgi:tRNA uridine 5-carboxymethylaminomethyl modification enzyme